MIYIVVSVLIVVIPVIATFAFVLAILKHQSKHKKESIKIYFKFLNFVELSIHTKTKRTTPDKRK